MSTELRAVIGLEFHVQLATETKLFCGCRAAFGAPPNSALCPLCAGLPGALPVLNRHAVEQGLRVALALGAEIAPQSRFARKSYFYPDLPKGYQISQYDAPLATRGALELPPRPAEEPAGRAWPQTIPLERLHLEEDAGKLLHRHQGSLVDLDRAGIPLLEVVTAPTIESPEQAAAAMRALRQLLRALGASRGNLEEGSLRCDANISLRQRDVTTRGPRTEIKNLNSFRHLKKALALEIARQGALYARGATVTEQTLLYDHDAGLVRPMRDKEQAADYRYFDEPDLPPLLIPPAWLSALASTLPELPARRAERLAQEHGLTPQSAREICREKELADYYEATVAAGAAPRRAAAWIRSQVLSRIADPRQLVGAKLTPAHLAELIDLLESGALGDAQAKKLWPRLWDTGGSALALAEAADLMGSLPEAKLAQLMEELFAQHPEELAALRAGREALRAFFVGRVMRACAGKADPRFLQQLIDKKLRKSPSCG